MLDSASRTSIRKEKKLKTLEQSVPTIPQLAKAGINTGAALRRHLHPTLFDRVVWDLVSVENFDGEQAVRAVDTAWAFLELCAKPAMREIRLGPPALVDAAWHATILYTRPYAELCAALGVRGIIHHEPFDDPGLHGSGGAPATALAFQEAGISYDQEFWDSAGPSKCAGCWLPEPFPEPDWLPEPFPEPEEPWI